MHFAFFYGVWWRHSIHVHQPHNTQPQPLLSNRKINWNENRSVKLYTRASCDYTIMIIKSKSNMSSTNESWKILRQTLSRALTHAHIAEPTNTEKWRKTDSTSRASKANKQQTQYKHQQQYSIWMAVHRLNKRGQSMMCRSCCCCFHFAISFMIFDRPDVANFVPTKVDTNRLSCECFERT